MLRVKPIAAEEMPLLLRRRGAELIALEGMVFVIFGALFAFRIPGQLRRATARTIALFESRAKRLWNARANEYPGQAKGWFGREKAKTS